MPQTPERKNLLIISVTIPVEDTYDGETRYHILKEQIINLDPDAKVFGQISARLEPCTHETLYKKKE